MKHVLPAAALLASGSVLLVPPALADQAVQPTRPVWGCVDPRATTALAIPDGRLRNRKWVEYVHRTGQCTLLPTGRPLNVLAHQGSLVLLKSPDASGDTLPVYAQSADMAAVEAPPAVAAAPVETQPTTPAPVPAPATTDAATPGPATPPPAAQTTAPPLPSPASDASAAATPPAAPAPVPVPVPTPSPSAAAPTDAVSPASPPPAAAPPAAAPIAAASAAASVAPPVTPPAPPPADAPPPVPAPLPVPVQHSSSGMMWLVLIVVLALLALVAAAVLVSRQQRRFAHVEDDAWQGQDEHLDPMASASQARSKLQPEPAPQDFRRRCIEVLEQGGWTIQPSFAASAAREGAPDILARRRDAILAVRCRGGSATVTPEIIDEVAAMGQAARAHVIVLATPAPLTRRAHDEAMRLHVHVLDGDELGSLSA